jgi:hypothetical protein
MTSKLRKLVSKKEIAKIIRFYPVDTNRFISDDQLSRLQIVERVYEAMGNAESTETFFHAPGLPSDCGWYLNIEKGSLNFSAGSIPIVSPSSFNGSIIEKKLVGWRKKDDSEYNDWDDDPDDDFSASNSLYKNKIKYLAPDEFEYIKSEDSTLENVSPFSRALILDWHEELFDRLIDLRAGEAIWIGGSERTGKTMAAEMYCQYLGLNIFKAPPDGSPDSLLEVLGTSLNKRYYNKHDRWEGVFKDYFQGFLFIDNAHYLKKSCYPYLKHIIDCGRTRVILIGNNSVTSHLKSNDMTFLFERFQVPKLIMADDVLDVVWSYCAKEVLSNKDILTHGIDELLSQFECFGREYTDFRSDINLAELIKIINRSLKTNSYAF